MEKTKTGGKNKDMRLWRRFSQIKKMDANEKRKVMQVLDTLIENERLKKKQLKRKLQLPRSIVLYKVTYLWIVPQFQKCF